MSLAAAEKLLLSNTIAKSSFQSFSVATLAELCSTYGMSVKATGKRPKGSKTKIDYITAIFSFVSRQCMIYCWTKKKNSPKYSEGHWGVSTYAADPWFKPNVN
jgi:hypothetical protein